MEEPLSPLVFSEWLKQRRKALDLTQDELAKRAGCSVGALRKIESGDRRPSKQLAALLGEALEIPGEDQQTFIRVARGDLTLERLRQPALESGAIHTDVRSLQPMQREAAFDTKPPAPPLKNRIPLQITSLIGRETEFVAMERLFSDPQCRLLTLTGIGGIGKTRLAIEFALRKQAEFPGGIYTIALTSVDSSEKIVPAIADVLDFGFAGPANPKDQLLNYLSSHIRQEALFIFDNLEHLLTEVSTGADTPGVVELISEILQRLPMVKILGTSRERLNLHGEWMYELHGLCVPPTDFVGRLEEYDSIALFLKSAQRIRSNFRITTEDQSSLIKIVQLVEGVPLAIELAAAWVGILPCQEIALEIEANMDFLTTAMRDIPERHRSMRATFEHSWKLLSEEERSALCQLSVFQGGFDRMAAQQIAGASLPLLASLSAKSLVRSTESGRFDLHELIRQFSMSHLNDQRNCLESYERHCDYYLAFVQERENSLKNASQQKAVRQLTDEIDNIRAAWTWAIENDKFDQLGRSGRGFGWYFEFAGLHQQGIEQLETLAQALKARPPDQALNRILGLALSNQALLYFRKGDINSAWKLYRESITILRLIGDQALLADALIFSGILLHLKGDYEQARISLSEGLDLARASGDRWFEAYAIYNLGYIDSLMGRYGEGYDQMHAALGMWRSLGDPHYIALGLNFLIPTLINLGRYDEAVTFMLESIALCEQTKNRWGLGVAYRYLGAASLATGDYKEAQRHLQHSLEIFSDYFTGWDIALSLTFLGHANLLAGDFGEARKIYQEALRSSCEVEAIPIALVDLSGIASLQAQAGKAEHALALCFYVSAHASSDEDTKSRAEHLAAALEPTLSAEQVKKAHLYAKEKPLDSVVKDVLEER